MKPLACALLTVAALRSFAQPDPRFSVAAAFDAERRDLITFGGRTNDGADSSETWRWNGTSWSRVSAAGPSARNGAAMIWDAARKRILLFGGVRGQQPLGDTWTWDGSEWTQVATAGPSARTLAGLAYDSRRQRVVLFGGLSGSTPLGDTWEWNGLQWIERTTSGPAARSLHGLAYDEVRGVTVLFAGNGGQGPGFMRNDTWLYDGTSWAEQSPPFVPKARDHVSMTFDATSQRIVVFGGYDGEQTNEMLEWDGAQWLPAPATGVSPRLFPVLTPDAAAGRLLLFGGFAMSPFNELWSFECDSWKQMK